MRTLLLALTLPCLLAGSASAAPAFGVGVIAGDPTGITLKFPRSEVFAIDMAFGMQSFNEQNAGRVHVDWLYSFATLAQSENADIPLYLGLGAILEGGPAGDELNFGARVPVGIALQLSAIPLEFFAEVGVDVIVIDNDPTDRNVGLEGAVGVRIYPQQRPRP
jgi:hypothetical protein